MPMIRPEGCDCAMTPLSGEPQQTLSVAEDSMSSLLNIPGEIRNRIYDFAAEDGVILPHQRPAEEDQKSHESYLPQNLPRFLGLTQVCRKIRAEFLPLYKARTTICLQPRNVHSFVVKFLKPGYTSDEMVVGKLIVDYTNGKNQVMNAKPLLQLARKAQGFTVTMMGDRARTDDTFQISLRSLVREGLHVGDLASFETYLDEAVDRLYLILWPSFPSRYVTDIFLDVNMDHWRPFMANFRDWCVGYDLLDHVCEKEWDEVEEWSRISGIVPERHSSGNSISFECIDGDCLEDIDGGYDQN